MTKQDLRSGMVVEVRCGKVYQFFKGISHEHYEGSDVLININGTTWMNIRDINNDLTSTVKDGLDIMKVYRSPVLCQTTQHCDYKEWDCVWEREEPKELTVAEIEKLLGYPVKIVKE